MVDHSLSHMTGEDWCVFPPSACRIVIIAHTHFVEAQFFVQSPRGEVGRPHFEEHHLCAEGAGLIDQFHHQNTSMTPPTRVGTHADVEHVRLACPDGHDCVPDHLPIFFQHTATESDANAIAEYPLRPRKFIRQGFDGHADVDVLILHAAQTERRMRERACIHSSGYGTTHGATAAYVCRASRKSSLALRFSCGERRRYAG